MILKAEFKLVLLLFYQILNFPPTVIIWNLEFVLLLNDLKNNSCKEEQH